MARKLTEPVFKVAKVPRTEKTKINSRDCCGDVEEMYNYLAQLYEWAYVMWDTQYGSGGGGTPPPPPPFPPP